jgi:hypothetical protein
MTNDHATITAIPPRPDFDNDNFDSDNDLAEASPEPWVTTAADLVAYLLADTADVRPDFVATGIADVDGPLGGLAPGTLTAVIASPGPGATAAMAAAAHHAAYTGGHPTLFYPLRSTAAGIARVLAHTHAQGDPDSDGVTGAVADLRTCPLYVSLGSPVTVSRIMADALDEDMDAPRLIVVDAVALLHPGRASRDLKTLALELNVPILCATTVHTSGADRPVTAADAPADLVAAADTIVALTPLALAAPPARRPRPQPIRPIRPSHP